MLANFGRDWCSENQVLRWSVQRCLKPHWQDKPTLLESNEMTALGKWGYLFIGVSSIWVVNSDGRVN